MLTSRVEVRRADTRGGTRAPGVEAWHAIRAARRQGARHGPIGPLAALDEAVLQPGAFLAWPAERDLEVVTLPLAGVAALEAAGPRGQLATGEAHVLRAPAGTEVRLRNPGTAAARVVQVGLAAPQPLPGPGSEQGPLAPSPRGGWQPVASAGGALGGLALAAEASVLVARLAAGARAGHVVHAGRVVLVLVLDGALALAGEALGAGDAALVRDGVAGARATADSVALLLDLPA